MYHINVILIFFIVFLAKTRVLTRKSCQFLTRKSLAERMHLLEFTPIVQIRYFLESNKAFMV